MRSSWLLAVLTLLVLPALANAGDPPKTKDKDVGKTFQVPFRLTDSGHIMVRAKLNGKGPYNFIVDTGAPLVYVSVAVAKKLGIVAEKKGFNTLDKLELEGGPVHTQFKCLIETPFQLEGMNAAGLAGVELHGILGYTLLAHYKMEIDLTRDKMAWTRLDYEPIAPQPLGMKGAEGLDAMSKLSKLLALRAKLLGIDGPPVPLMRGFFGIELGEKERSVFVRAVLAKGPAQAAGVQKGDVVTRVQRYPVRSSDEMLQLLARATAGRHLRFTVHRGGELKAITVTAGEGL
jgi:hypothetical protein